MFKKVPKPDESSQIYNNRNPLKQYNCMSGKANLSHNASRVTEKSMRKEFTKSMVEDASEDFSNIEEHISSLIQQNQIESP